MYVLFKFKFITLSKINEKIKNKYKVESSLVIVSTILLYNITISRQHAVAIVIIYNR